MSVFPFRYMYTSGIIIGTGITDWFLFRIQPGSSADPGQVLINATVTWPTTNSTWSRNPASVTIQVTMTVPSAPQTLTAIAGNELIMLNWAMPASDGYSQITGYRVYQGTTSGNETLNVTIGNMLTYTSTSLKNGQIYYFKVEAINAIGVGPNSTEANATPDALITISNAPNSLTAQAGLDQVVLNWISPSNNGGSAIMGYRVYCGTTSNGETFLFNPGNVTTYTAVGLTNGQMYYFKVAAINVMGAGTNSTETKAMPVGPPTAPQSLTATPGNAQIVLNWTVSASNGGSAIMGYWVYCGTTSNGETFLFNPGNVTTYTAVGLTNGQLYYFKVAAVNANGTGENTTEVSATPVASKPTAPQSFTATAVNGQILLSWTMPASNGGSAIISYKIYRGTFSGGEELYATIGSVLTYTDKNVTNGQAYYYMVSAVNGVGEGNQSIEANAMCSSNPGFNEMIIVAGIFVVGLAVIIIVVGVVLHRRKKLAYIKPSKKYVSPVSQWREFRPIKPAGKLDVNSDSISAVTPVDKPPQKPAPASDMQAETPILIPVTISYDQKSRLIEMIGIWKNLDIKIASQILGINENEIKALINGLVDGGKIDGEFVGSEFIIRSDVNEFINNLDWAIKQLDYGSKEKDRKPTM